VSCLSVCLFLYLLLYAMDFMSDIKQMYVYICIIRD